MSQDGSPLGRAARMTSRWESYSAGLPSEETSGTQSRNVEAWRGEQKAGTLLPPQTPDPHSHSVGARPLPVVHTLTPPGEGDT